MELKSRVFLDTNVLVDVLMDESRPSYACSTRIFQFAKQSKLEAFITTQSIIDASYICSKIPGKRRMFFRDEILKLLNYINVEHIDTFDIRDATKIGGSDFEDDALFAHAESKGVDVLVTSDRKFISSHPATDMFVMTPEDFMSHLKQE